MLLKDQCLKRVSYYKKRFDLGLKPCVVINKVDKENCTPEEVHEKVFDLMFELGATEAQVRFPSGLWFC